MNLGGRGCSEQRSHTIVLQPGQQHKTQSQKEKKRKQKRTTKTKRIVMSSVSNVSFSFIFFFFLVEMGFHHVNQAVLELLTSSDPPTSASPSATVPDHNVLY